jgi:ribosomal protein S12 methylthiotransferase
VGTDVEVLVDGTGERGALTGRTHREAPEIDGVVRLHGAAHARPGSLVTARVVDVEGPDLDARALAAVAAGREAAG